MRSFAIKMILTSIVGSTLVLLSGCSQTSSTTNQKVNANTIANARSAKIKSSSSQPPAYTDTLLSEADMSFHHHAWDDAILGYQNALAQGLPHGESRSNGTDEYARHKLSLAYEYRGLGEKDSSNLYSAEQDMQEAIDSERKNIPARKLLAEVVSEENAADNPASQGKTDTASDQNGESETAGASSSLDRDQRMADAKGRYVDAQSAYLDWSISEKTGEKEIGVSSEGTAKQIYNDAMAFSRDDRGDFPGAYSDNNHMWDWYNTVNNAKSHGH